MLMSFLSNLFGGKGFRVERNRLGEFSFEFNTGPGFNNTGKYLDMSLENPVLMTIIGLRAQVYSQMEIRHVDSNNKDVVNSPYIKLLDQPNYFQSKEDFFYQQMWFLSACGFNYTYQKKSIVQEIPVALYNLIPNDLDLNKVNKLNKFIATEQDIKAFNDRKVKYKLDDLEQDIRIGDIIPFYDLANGLMSNSIITSPSRIKGISKIVENIEENIKAKNTNLRMSQKFLSTKKGGMQGVETPLKDADRKSIENILGRKALQITSGDISVTHLVTDLKKLFLDEQFADDANKCVLAFEMNKNVINYFSKDSTFDNQDKGMIAWVQNSIHTTAKNTMNSMSQQWGLIEKGERLIASYDHLDFMQSLAASKAAAMLTMEQSIKLSLENGTMTKEEARQMHINFMIKLKL
jgi:hypothetical protein